MLPVDATNINMFCFYGVILLLIKLIPWSSFRDFIWLNNKISVGNNERNTSLNLEKLS